MGNTSLLPLAMPPRGDKPEPKKSSPIKADHLKSKLKLGCAVEGCSAWAVGGKTLCGPHYLKANREGVIRSESTSSSAQVAASGSGMEVSSPEEAVSFGQPPHQGSSPVGRAVDTDPAAPQAEGGTAALPDAAMASCSRHILLRSMRWETVRISSFRSYSSSS